MSQSTTASQSEKISFLKAKHFWCNVSNITVLATLYTSIGKIKHFGTNFVILNRAYVLKPEEIVSVKTALPVRV